MDIADGEILNVGTGIPTTIEDLALEACQLNQPHLKPLYEATSEGEFSTLVEGKKRNSAELRSMLLDISKARHLLGWRPQVPLAQGLRREFVWAKTNPRRWQKINYTVV